MHSSLQGPEMSHETLKSDGLATSNNNDSIVMMIIIVTDSSNGTNNTLCQLGKWEVL